MTLYNDARAGNQLTISTRFSKRKKPQGNSWVIIQVDLASNDKIESEGRLPGKSLTRLSPDYKRRYAPLYNPSYNLCCHILNL